MIDTHCHLYSDEFIGDLNEVIDRAKKAGVDNVYMPAIDSTTHDAMIALAEQHQAYCIPMMGLHPCYVESNYEDELKLVEDWLGKRKFAAIGEIGLDYYHSIEYKSQQIAAFSTQINMAIAHNLPIVIHTRSSMDDCIRIVEEVGEGKITGIFHCFGGDERQAKKIIELGFMLGIGGVLTYKNAGLARVLESIPIDSIVLETDAPYLSPVPFRGKRNEASYVQFVAEKISEIKGLPLDEVIQSTTANAKKIFGF
jgi:TatD DNase family protein